MTGTAGPRKTVELETNRLLFLRSLALRNDFDFGVLFGLRSRRLSLFLRLLDVEHEEVRVGDGGHALRKREVLDEHFGADLKGLGVEYDLFGNVARLDFDEDGALAVDEDSAVVLDALAELFVDDAWRCTSRIRAVALPPSAKSSSMSVVSLWALFATGATALAEMTPASPFLYSGP